MMQRGSITCAVFAGGLWCFIPPVLSDDTFDQRRARDEQILAEFGIASTPEGALAYLKSLIPIGDPNDVVQGLIRQLGDDEFERREAAAARLISMPSLPRGKLEAALSSNDVEIRWRARLVLDRLSTTGNRPLLAALRIVSIAPPDDAVDVLLRLSGFESPAQQQAALRQTLLKIANESHTVRLVQEAEGQGPIYSRIAAAYVLQRLRDQQGGDLLAKLLDADQPRAVLVAAKYLANSGDHRALAALVRLLESEDLAVAGDSANFLTALIGREFGYSPFDDAASRQKAAAEAQRWLAAEGQTAALSFPVAEPAAARGDLAGHTLVATGSLGYVAQLDPKGKEVWRYQVVAWGAEKLINGNVIIASYQSNQLLELNKDGTVVWSLSGINAMRAKPLADGHLLVADYGGSRVLELNDVRQEVWSLQTPDNCFDAERLANGHTVYCCPGLIREVDADGQPVRDLPIDGRANSVQVLPNGRWLVANFQKNQVQEYDREGKIVWSFDERSPCDAFRLTNGKTLVTSNGRGIEVAADNKTVREIVLARYGCVRQ